MRTPLYLAALAVAVVGCTERVTVSSASAPSLDTTPYRTFALMPATSSETPDSVRAIIGRAIRTDLEHSFAGRGYAESANPDFLVAYYGGTGDVLNGTA